MKVLFFSPYFIPYVSGLTTYPANLFPRLGGDVDVRVLCFAHRPGLPARESMAGCEVLRMAPGLRVSKGFVAAGSLAAFSRQLDWAERVILNLPSVEGLPLAWMARRRGIPVLALLHCRIDLGPGLLQRVLSGSVNRLVDRQLGLADQIVGYTRSYLEACGVYARHGAKIVIAPPPVPELPVDPHMLERLGTLGGERAIRIGFSGRMAREKGIGVLIEALSGLPPELRGRVVLLLAGPAPGEVVGEGAYGRAMLARLAATGIAHHHLGTLRNGTLGAFYRALHLLVLPSVNLTEAFGMVQIEALRAGTPVIASALPGVREPVERTGMGLLVPPADAAALSAAIVRVAQSPEAWVTPQSELLLRRTYDPDLAPKVFLQWLNNPR